jgi:hypothetical protein
LAKCILKLKKENIEGLILDLRGNGGGSLREAVDMSGLFIDYGPVVAMSNSKGEVEVLKDFNRGALYTGPLKVVHPLQRLLPVCYRIITKHSLLETVRMEKLPVSEFMPSILSSMTFLRVL